MHVLMIGQLTGKEYNHLLPEEGAFIGPLRAEGLVQDVFLKADHTGPVLILADVTADQARERMAELPFIVHDIATFDYIEMILPPAGLTDNQ
ncbi:MAG: hypothetical protein ACLP0J_29105 [Solirubrobacteraceae bacterium]